MKEEYKVAGWTLLIALLGADIGFQSVRMFGSPDNPERRQERTEQAHNAQDKSGTTQSAAAPSADVSASKSRPKSAATYGPNRNQDPKGDSIWVIFQGLSAPVVALFTAVLVWVACLQLRTYRRQADILDRQARIQESLAGLEAPLIFPVAGNNMGRVLSSPHFDELDDWSWPDMPRIDFRFKNYGKVPAILRSISAKIDYGATAPGEDTAYPHIDLPREIVLSPERDTDERQSCFIKAMKRAEYQRLMRGEAFFWWFGYVQYFDMLGADFVMHFCWRYHCADRIFGPHGKDRNYTERLKGAPHDTHSAV